MDRRTFLRCLLDGSAAVVAPQRAYSFLRNNPLALDGYEFHLGAYSSLYCGEPMLVMLRDEPLVEAPTPIFHEPVFEAYSDFYADIARKILTAVHEMSCAAGGSAAVIWMENA